MTTLHIELSKERYQRLQEQATRRGLTPVQLAEQLLSADEMLLPHDDDVLLTMPHAGSPEALAAVERLSRLFADVPGARIDQVLADPLLAIENTSLDDLS